MLTCSTVKGLFIHYSAFIQSEEALFQTSHAIVDAKCGEVEGQHVTPSPPSEDVNTLKIISESQKCH